MKIHFLGTGHGYAEKNRYTSCTVIEVGGNYYLIDAGAPVEYLFVNNDMSYEDVRGIFITHMHNDHVGALSTVVEPMLRYRFNDKAVCFFPSEEGKDAFSNWLYALGVDAEHLKKTVKFDVINEGEFFNDGNIKVRAVRTDHLGKGGPAFGFVVEAEGKKVFFTGDMSYMFREYCDIALGEHYDLFVCEGAHFRLRDTKEMLMKTNTDRMIFNHIFYESTEGHEEILGEFPFPAMLSYDGMVVEL